jgi:hypothetical protein
VRFLETVVVSFEEFDYHLSNVPAALQKIPELVDAQA